MAKTKEELNVLKEEIETLKKKLAELTEDELEQVNGGGVLHDSDVLQDIGLKKKKCYCTQCGYVRMTFPEGAHIVPQIGSCPQCGADDSFAIGDA